MYCTFMIISSLILLRMRNVADKCTENQNIHFMFSNVFFQKKKSTDENIIRRMRTACWILKATDTHSEYVILLFYRSSGFADAPRCYVTRTSPVFFIGHLFLVDCLVCTVHFPHFLKSAPQYITFRSGPRNRESTSCKVRLVPPLHNDQTASGAYTRSNQMAKTFRSGWKITTLAKSDRSAQS